VQIDVLVFLCNRGLVLSSRKGSPLTTPMERTMQTTYQWMHPVGARQTARAQLTATYRIRSLTMSCNFAAVRT